MASPRTRRVLKELRPLSQNNFFSFVRSVTMDKWKDVELAKMRVGGNQKFREFLESQPDYREDWSLHDKYNSRAAALFRDKVQSFLALFGVANGFNSSDQVATEAEGGEWSAATSAARNYVPSSLGAGDRIRGDTSRFSSATSLGSYYGGNAAAYSDGGGYNTSDTSQSDERYRGFGNTVDSASTQDDLLAGAMSSLSMGWSIISRGASQAAAIAKDCLFFKMSLYLLFFHFSKANNGGILFGVASKATEIGQKSWGGISQFVKSPSLQGLGSILPKS
ncbi:unnamed protein product [Angiostrongylus costaricensis]|uniref:Arf-GAP domain-containing protein n=1 Tax=Angiostrongylus costaricensis TaxID=334426 RepID=A0A0R3PG03_ANGCS|nr:unnamed protein product [Angiostrongylus costaricensis]